MKKHKYDKSNKQKANQIISYCHKRSPYPSVERVNFLGNLGIVYQLATCLLYAVVLSTPFALINSVESSNVSLFCWPQIIFQLIMLMMDDYKDSSPLVISPLDDVWVKKSLYDNFHVFPGQNLMFWVWI